MKKMTRDEFTELLDIYSADFSFWPADSIKPALALIEQDPACKAAFDEALLLDDGMRRADAAMTARLDRRLGDTSALAARIMAEIDSPQLSAPMPAPVARTAGWKVLFAPGGGLLMIAVFGFMMGLQQPALGDDGADAIVGGVDVVIAADGSDISREAY